MVDDAALFDRFPSATIDHDNKEYFRGLLQRRLLLNRCDDCGHWHNPPLPRCPSCLSAHLTATEVSGQGTLHLLTLLHQGPPTPGVDYSEPYPVVAVELIEQIGLRFTTTVVGCPPSDLHIGLPVRLSWIERTGNPFPVFAPDLLIDTDA